MLNRQKVVLALLQMAGGSASRIQLAKWLFLLAEEFPSRGGSAFYTFLPYKFGPYSFSLAHEMDLLVRDGLVDAPDDRSWHLSESGKQLDPRLKSAVKFDVNSVLEKYGDYGPHDLMELIYARYPWFTLLAENTDQPRVGRPCADLAVYTAGYEGLMVEEFLDLFLSTGIYRVIDVRNNPWSRRFGFQGRSLERFTSRLGMEYAHFPELGIPSKRRVGLSETHEFAELFQEYEREMLPHKAASLSRLKQLLLEKPGVLICIESDPNACHRSRLANRVSAEIGLPVLHLRG